MILTKLRFDFKLSLYHPHGGESRKEERTHPYFRVSLHGELVLEIMEMGMLERDVKKK